MAKNVRSTALRAMTHELPHLNTQLRAWRKNPSKARSDRISKQFMNLFADLIRESYLNRDPNSSVASIFVRSLWIRVQTVESRLPRGFRIFEYGGSPSFGMWWMFAYKLGERFHIFGDTQILCGEGRQIVGGELNFPPFAMTNVRPKHTGLPMLIWLPSRLVKPQIRVQPRHGDKVIHPGECAGVTIENAPRLVAGRLAARDLALVRRFIRLNRSALVRLWSDEIDPVDFVRLIKKS